TSSGRPAARSRRRPRGSSRLQVPCGRRSASDNGAVSAPSLSDAEPRRRSRAQAGEGRGARSGPTVRSLAGSGAAGAAAEAGWPGRYGRPDVHAGDLRDDPVDLLAVDRLTLEQIPGQSVEHRAPAREDLARRLVTVLHQAPHLFVDPAGGLFTVVGALGEVAP